MLKAAATLAFLLILAGWITRRNRARHVPLVVAGILIDLALVIGLEAQRSVIDQAVEREMSWPEGVHVAASIVAVALYLPTIGFGVAILRGSMSAGVRKAHAVSATLALFARAVGFAFMWGF